MILSGSLTEVSTVPLGDTVAGAHAAGVTVLTMNGIVDFEGVEEVVVVDDTLDPGVEHALAVTTVDTDLSTITLAAPLPINLDDDAFVAVSPASEEKVALVLIDGTEDPITARVPHYLYAYVADGIRDPGTEESVEVDDASGSWVVRDVLGLVPTLDGTVIDPDTLPEPEPPASSDGLPPAEASVLTFIGGIGSIFFKWSEVDNADPVMYRLHVVEALTTDPPPVVPTDGSAELVSGVGLTAAAVRKMPSGAVVVGDGSVTYYGVVTISDADGPGPDSNVASGVPAQINTPDIAVGALTADLLTANDAIIDALNATDFTTVTMTGPTIQTALAGALVRIHEVNGDGVIELHTGDPDEIDPARITGGAEWGTSGVLLLMSPEKTGLNRALIRLESDGPSTGDDEILLDATVVKASDEFRIGNGLSTGSFRFGPIAHLPPTVWQDLTIQPPFANVVSQACKYKRDAAGNVHLRGAVTRNTASQTDEVAVLPVGFRPNFTVYGVCRGAAANLPQQIRVDPTGEVFFSWAGTAPASLGIDFVFNRHA